MHVLVIGAGLQGVCTAYFLAANGAEVTVIERREGAALETSLGNAGYIQIDCPKIWNTPGLIRALPKWWWASLGRRRHSAAMVLHTSALLKLIPWGTRFLRTARRQSYFEHTALNRELAIYSAQQLAAIRERESIDYAQSFNGAIWVFRDASGMASHAPLLDYLGERGADCRMLDREALLNLEPSLRPIGDALVGGIHFPRDEAGDSYRFTRALAGIAVARGVRFEYGTTVQRIESHAGSVVARSGAGALDADAVVIAAGMSSKRLAGQLAVSLPIAAAKGHSITVPFGAWRDRPRHVVGDMSLNAAVNPLGGVLRVGGTAEFAGHDLRVSPARIEYLLGLVEKVLPEFAAVMDRSDVKPFAGLRPLSADGLPMIGATHIPNVYVNTGHGALGWTQAAGSARALADALTGIRDAFDLSPFSPRRFQRQRGRQK